MKTIFHIVFFLFLSSFAYSQSATYHPFPHENSEWSLIFGNETFEPFDTTYHVQKFQAGGDSIIDSKIYIKYKSGTGVFSLFRDDTVTKKVYTLYDDGVTRKDTLLYDFNLLVGASASHSIEFLDYPDASVSAIDSVFIDGNYRKRIQISYTNDFTPDSTFWIEGIGSTNGIQLGPHDAFELPSYRKLICYKESGNLLYSELEDWYDCDTILIEQDPISLINLGLESIFIYPNPIDDLIFINGDQNILSSISEVQFYNVNGILVYSTKLSPSYIITTPKFLEPGFYILLLKNSTNSYTFKALKE